MEQLSTRNDQERTPLHKAAAEEGQFKLVHLLIESGANVHAIDDNGSTVLHIASSSGCLNIVKLLLRQGADIDWRNHDNKTAADLAPDNCQAEVASFLADFTVDEIVQNKVYSNLLDTIPDNSEDEDGTELMSLHDAVEDGELGIVRLLLAWGADVDA
jgi:ankyrin repeat protein